MTSLRNPLATLLTITTALVCAPWACSGPADSDTAEIRVHLVLPPQAYGLTKGSAPHSIEETPLVLWAAIEGEDIATPVTDQWMGRLDEEPVLSLSVEAGSDRSLSVLLFRLTDTQVDTYRALVTNLDLVPGDQDVTVTLQQAPEWTLEADILPDESSPTHATVMEVQTKILFPAQPVTLVDGRASVTLEHLPVGRFFYLLVQDENGTWSEPLTECPLWSGKQTNLARTFSLAEGTCSAEDQ